MEKKVIIPSFFNNKIIMALESLASRIEQLSPDVEKIMGELAEKIKNALQNDQLIAKNPEIIAIREELVRSLGDASNLEFGILKNEPDVPTTTERGRYLAALAIKRARNNLQGEVRMPVLPNRIDGECSFDTLFESLGLDGYRKLIELECLNALDEIQKRQASERDNPLYKISMRGGPSGAYEGNTSQANIDSRYLKRAQWLLDRLKEGESPFSVVQPFKKIRPDYEERRNS